MLHRRRFLTYSSGLALGAVTLLLGRGALAQPSYTVPLAQLQEMVASSFRAACRYRACLTHFTGARCCALREVESPGHQAMAVDAAGPALRRMQTCSTWNLRCATRPATAPAPTRCGWGGWIFRPSAKPAVRSSSMSTPRAGQAIAARSHPAPAAPADTAMFDGPGPAAGADHGDGKGLTVAFVGPAALRWIF